MDKDEFLRILKNPLKLSDKCKNCKWYKEYGSNKPCNYIYCGGREND